MRLKKLVPLLLIIFVINFVWEFCHYSLYLDLTGIPKIPHIFLASLVDVVLVFSIFLLVSFKDKNSKWIDSPKEKDYFFLVFFGLILAFVWEFVNLNLGRWMYKWEMPLFFGVGLSPLLQLSATAIMSLCVYNCLMQKC